jgi:hypothetical protein
VPRKEPIRKESSGPYVVVLNTAAQGEWRRQVKRRFDTLQRCPRAARERAPPRCAARFVPPQKVTVIDEARRAGSPPWDG